MTNISKAVILARGLGKRMRRADAETALAPGQSRVADAGLKAMIPIGRPFLDYVLSALADAGFGHVCLVIGPEHDLIRTHYTRTSPPRRVRVEFAVQPEPLGTANAVLAAQEFAGSDEFVVLNSDNYYPAQVLQQLRVLGEPGVTLFEPAALVRESNIPADRVRDFAFAWADHSGYLQGLIEKPDDATLHALGAGALVSMNAWRFAPAIFDICRAAPLSARGEYELPSAVMAAIQQRRLQLKVVKVAAGVLDLSRRSDIADVARRLRTVEPNP